MLRMMTLTLLSELLIPSTVKEKGKDPATPRVISAEQRRFVSMSSSPRPDWLTISRPCSNDVVADEMVVNDVYVPQVNVYTLYKAKAGDPEDAMLPRVKTLAKATLP